MKITFLKRSNFKAKDKETGQEKEYYTILGYNEDVDVPVTFYVSKNIYDNYINYKRYMLIPETNFTKREWVDNKGRIVSSYQVVK